MVKGSSVLGGGNAVFVDRERMGEGEAQEWNQHKERHSESKTC